MAALCVEMEQNERLNHTLSGLRSTSKGQLKYNSNWEFSGDVSDEVDCTLQSYFSHSPECIRLISNISFESEEYEDLQDENVSADLITNNEMKPQVDTISEGKDSSIDNKSRNISRPIAANFECTNEFTILDYHKKTKEIAEETKTNRTKVFQRRTQNLIKDTHLLQNKKQKELDEVNEQLKKELLKREREVQEETKRDKEQLDKQAKEHKKKLEEIIRKAIIEESHLVKEEEKRKEVLANIKKNITSLYNQVMFSVDAIQKKFKDFPYMSSVAPESYKGVAMSLRQVVGKAEAASRKSKSITDLTVAEGHLKDMVTLFEETISIEKNVGIILKMAEDNAMKMKKDIEKAKLKQEEMKNQSIKPKGVVQENIGQKATGEKELPINKKNSSLGSKVSTQKPKQESEEARCISDDAFTQYVKLQKLLKATQDSFKEFAADPKQTKYKFDLHKAVNVPINALSSQSPSHLNDKILRLVSLLGGQNVSIVGKTVNCNSHPSALAFCKNLVAKKLVMQGAQQVSSSPSSAFIYAAVIVGIWSAFPDVGQLILAHFHLSYPYLVPYYMPMEEGQSTSDYHKALGYSIVQDKIEDQDKFLKKFSGTVQLYAAVVTSSGADQSDHPHGVSQGWIWLARVLNLKPHPSVTATMLYHFISVSGHVLMKKYGRQFQKLLLVLCREFVPVIDKVTPAEKRGPTQRLKDFLEECIKMKQIPVPEGYLTERWWQSGHF